MDDPPNLRKRWWLDFPEEGCNRRARGSAVQGEGPSSPPATAMKQQIHSTVLLLSLLIPACSSEAPDFSGRFASKDLQVKLSPEGEVLKGEIVMQGRRYSAEARVEGAELKGQFSADGQDFPFTARWEGGQLALASGGSTYTLERQQAANPLARQTQNPLAGGGASVAPKKPAGQPAREPAGQPNRPAAGTQPAATPDAKLAGLKPRGATKTFRHDSGVAFRHPEDWRPQALADGVISLVPPDLNKVVGQPAEAFLVFGDDADGAQDIGAPAVIREVQGMVRQMFPALQQQGEPQVSSIGGRKTLTLKFGGDVQARKMQASLRLFLHQGRAIGALTVTDETRFAKRDAAMQQLYGSIAFAKAKVDQNLIGSWQYSKTYISGSFSSVTIRNMVLKADGTCLEGGKMMMGMEHTDNAGNYTGSTSGDSGQGVEHRGRWHTQGKNIVLQWQGGGSETWSYYIEGNSMLWSQGKTKKLWKRR